MNPMHRFFLPKESITNNEVIFPEDISRQISRVLRLKSGSGVIVLDGLGMEYEVNLTIVDPINTRGSIVKHTTETNEPNVEINLVIALTQREKFEWILQKSTEIGVTSFTPFISSRSLVQKPHDFVEKYARWNKIIQEAAEQSHRGIIPILNPVLSLTEYLNQSIAVDLKRLLFWEDEKQLGLKDILREQVYKKLDLVIGPEGGFSTLEAETAMRRGCVCVSLGARILRMETAAIIASGLVLYELG
jgi:16S rRNA (uracil1498-N3)-methyltransferase